jgi:hypothetical protein
MPEIDTIRYAKGVSSDILIWIKSGTGAFLFVPLGAPLLLSYQKEISR